MSYHLTSAMKLNANQDEWSAPRAGHLSPKPPHLHSKTSHRAKTTKQVRWAAEVLVYEIPANENSAGRKVTRGKSSSKRRSSTPRKSPQQLAAESGPTAKSQNSSAKAAEETDPSPVPESRDHSHRERVKQQKPVPPAVPQIHTKAKPFRATKVKYFPVTVTHGPDHRFCGCHDGFYEVQYLEDDLPNSDRKSRKSNSADKVDLDSGSSS